jgi:hypothetical protein
MHTKDKGSLAEARFLAKAYELGFSVLIPWGDNRPYDLVLEKDGRFIRVQVKGCYSIQTGVSGCQRYGCNVKKNSRSQLRYTSSTVDALAIYLAPEDVWYIVPMRFIDTFAGTTLQFYPRMLRHAHRCSTAVSEQFREKWDIITGDEK